MNGFEHWIGPGNSAPFYARRNITLKDQPVDACAYVCGLGQFNFYVNGKKAGPHVLDPVWTDYRKHIEGVEFHLEDMDLHQGDNVLGLEVGNGWFILDPFYYTFSLPDFMPPNPNPYRPFAKTLMASVQLEVTYANGETERFDTRMDPEPSPENCAAEKHPESKGDAGASGWQIAPHPVIRTNVYGSERIDGGKIIDHWNTLEGFHNPSAAEGWSPALPITKEDLPAGVRHCGISKISIQVIADYPGVHLIDHVMEDGTIRSVYDLSQNCSFLLKAQVTGPKGAMVRIFPAEKLSPDQHADQQAKGWCLVNNCVEYILGKDHQPEEIQSVFSYLSGRYLEIEHDACVSVLDVHAQAISSAWKPAGCFSCDDERYNQIYALVEKAVEANLVSVHTDCPTIERFAWQEPNHLMAPSIFFMKDAKDLWNKFFSDLRWAQHSKEDVFNSLGPDPFYPGDGLVPSQAPCYFPNVLPIPGMGSFYDIIPWGSTAILGVYWHYLFYQDLQVIRDNYEMGIRYFKYLLMRTTPEGLINHGLGDWGNPRQILIRENVETAFLYADACVLAEFAGLLEQPEDQAWLTDEARRIKDHYNQNLLVYDPQEQLWCYRAGDTDSREMAWSQAAQALPLFWNLTDKEVEADVMEAFRRTLQKENSFCAGEVTLPYIIQTADRCGFQESIAAFITREEHPSYYGFVKDGLTTLGEYWEPNPRSHCHDMMGHIVEWFYKGMAGIQPLQPGFSAVRIRPWLPESVHELHCSYPCVHGLIAVHLQETPDRIDLQIVHDPAITIETDLSRLEQRKPVQLHIQTTC